MIRWAVGIIAGTILVVTLAWNAGRHWDELRAPTVITQTPRPVSPSATPAPSATAPAVVERVGGTQIIERDRITERDTDDSDEAPRVQVVVPTSRPTPQRTTTAPRTSPPRTNPPSNRPLLPELPVQTPKIPDMPNLGGVLRP